SQLAPDEKTILATNGDLNDVVVTAIDPSDREVSGDVRYVKESDVNQSDINQSDYVKQPEPHTEPSFSEGPSPSGGSSEAHLSIQTVEEPPKPADSNPINQDTLSRFNISIITNKSSGYQGDVLEYDCRAVNVCNDTLSDVRLYCAGKMTSTTYLIPGKEISLKGTLVINDNMNIKAGVQGQDVSGKLWTSNASTKVWMIYPELKLNITSPNKVHRGQSVSLAVDMANIGKNRLTNLLITDTFGELGRIPLLQPGESYRLARNISLNKSMQYEAQVIGLDSLGTKVYASQRTDLNVFTSGLNISADQSEVTSYSNQPVNITWTLKNTGEESLKNITLGSGEERCRLNELLPGSSAKIEGVYVKENTSTINVTAEGYDPKGYTVDSMGSVLIKTISPGICLTVMPPEIEAFKGETFDLSCLVTNTGDDPLTNVVLRQDDVVLATVDYLAPGEFRATSTRLIADTNATFEFRAEGKDSKGRIWSDSVPFNVIIGTSGIWGSASATMSGETASITCKVTNLGNVALYNTLVLSKTFGQLGTIDYLPPNGQRFVTAERTVNSDVDDLISIEAFTFDKQAVNTSCRLLISEPKQYPTSESVQSSGSGILSGIDNEYTGNPEHISSTDVPKRSSIKSAINSTAANSGNDLFSDIEGMILSVKRMLGHTGDEVRSNYNSIGLNTSADIGNADIDNIDNTSEDNISNDNTSAYSETNYDSSNEISSSTDIREATNASRDYELSIASIRGSEHGAISILDISASPSQPAAGQPVKISVHAKSANAVRSAKAKWGISDVPLTKQDMMDMDMTHIMPMTLESGNSMDGYWGCTIPGRSGGTYMVLSVAFADGSTSAEDGPYMLHWSTVRSDNMPQSVKAIASSGKGVLIVESTVVNGKGDVSIKDNLDDSAVGYNERMIGNGSINLESEKRIEKSRPGTNFTERRDLVFTGGILKGQKSLESPSFDGGMGASVTERFNLSHVDRSETDMVRTTNYTYNTLVFSTDQAFDGNWNIQTQYSQFYQKMKADQQYTGSFQTQKKIQFDDQGK
ncbi:MAG: hypothetical protein WB392_07600, partial [Methanotrichaceae archaeon]